MPAAGAQFIQDNGSSVRRIQNHPAYAAMVGSLDESVGRIMDKLAALGLETNTAIVFTSDNGGLSSGRRAPSCNLPLRMGKGWPYEGGVREPFLVKWPGVVAPGSVCHTPVISNDLYPTLLQIAGLPPRPQQHPDGKSLMSLLRGASLPGRPLFWHYPHYTPQGGSPSGAVRLGDFKLIEWYEDMRVELYNLKDDIGEHQNLAEKMPEKAAEMRTLLHDWRAEVNAQMPTQNPNYNPPGASPGGKNSGKAGKKPAGVSDGNGAQRLLTTRTDERAGSRQTKLLMHEKKHC